MYKLYWLLFISIFISAASAAQHRMVNGYLRDSTTLFPVPDGTLTNAATNKSVQSDEKGFFRMDASPGDFIYAAAKSYHHDTLQYSYIFTDTISVFLSYAGNILPAVTVKGQYSRYQLDSMERRAEFLQNSGTPQKTFSSSHPSGFGLTINLDKVFKKKYRYQKRDEQVFSQMEKMAYIDYRFSPHVVAYYTGFKGDKLRTFMNLYSPTYQWLRSHTTNEDVLYYINDKLKEYKASKHK